MDLLGKTLTRVLGRERIPPGGFMDILAAIKREEKRLEKQLGKLQHQLNRVRAAAKALGDSTSRELNTVKKRVMSAAARAKISKATKLRWAKFRAAKAKGKR
jgi:hypothetical protein